MRRLGDETSPAVAAAGPRTLLVPVGSVEQHGPHLPLDTDTRIAVAVAEAVTRSRPDTVLAPAVTYGSSGEHQAFAGTLSIGAATLTSVLVELGRSAFPKPATEGAASIGGRGPAEPDHDEQIVDQAVETSSVLEQPGERGEAFDRLVFVNGHGGNVDPVRAAVDLLVAEGRPAVAWSPAIPGGDLHAGRTETSLLLAIDADRVGPDRPSGATAPLAELLGPMRIAGVAAVSPNGVLGDAAGASAEEGTHILAALTRSLLRTLDDR